MPVVCTEAPPDAAAREVSHYMRSKRDADGRIVGWVCVHCGHERTMADLQG